MTLHVKKVAVLGSGVMGSAIAAHFANAGIPSLVLDIVPGEPNEAERKAGLGLDDRRVRDRIARDSVRALLKTKPSPLFTPERLELVETGNLEDDLPRLAEADWVIEAVREDMRIKTRLLPAAAVHLRDDAVLSSNTSGLSLTEMAEALPEQVRPRFLGTHFFNPPRYMKLLELVPTPHTSPELASAIADFAGERLGKGVVFAKDTPNFIANRIGVHAIMVTFQVMRELGLGIEEVDALTGPLLARPKTATFRLADMVGIDTLLYVAKNTHALVPDDESRDALLPPDFLTRMVDKGLLGRKSGAGFYKKAGKQFLVLDLDTLEYREARRPELPGLDEMRTGNRVERLRRLVLGEGPVSRAAWKLLAPTLSYSAMRLGEIADDAATVDRALELGFNWEAGPFELWNTLGFRAVRDRLAADDYPLPGWVEALYDSGATTLYQQGAAGRLAPVARPLGLAAVAPDPRHVRLDALRRGDTELRSNRSASLLDLGDGVFCLEFHSKMNAIDGDTLELTAAAVDDAERRGVALVLANDGGNFCAGANLELLLRHARDKRWDAIEEIVRTFQRVNDRLERSTIPVVVAPHGMALGGGCEVVMAGNAVRAAAEAYIGLVEIGAGVIPAGGGCMRLYRRNLAGIADEQDPYPALRRTFETIGMAKVSTSAEGAARLGFLRPRDGWSMNRDHLTADAAQVALGLARAGFTPPQPKLLPVLGRGGGALLESGLVNMLEGRFISPHDAKIGRELARILAGGDIPGPTRVSEQHLLDLECESFLRLCGETKTQERMLGLLETGKPVRN